jgi:hypothetical protein
MTAVLTVLLVLMLSLIVTRAATIALAATGLSRESARFQSRSAFSGAGFTTSESESVVGHPVRRRIIMWLMLAGNAGIVAVMASLVLAAVEANDEFNVLLRVVAIVVGIGLLWLIFQSRWIDRRITAATMAGLRRWTTLDAHDYASLLHIGGEYGVTELQVQEGDWLARHTLGELALRKEGVIVLGVERTDGTYFGVPNADTEIHPLDVLVLYSRRETVAELDRRRKGGAGDAAHLAAVREQARVVAEERPERTA